MLANSNKFSKLHLVSYRLFLEMFTLLGQEKNKNQLKIIY